MCFKWVIIFLTCSVLDARIAFPQTSKLPVDPTAYFNSIIKNIRDDYYFIDKVNLDSIAVALRPLVTKAQTTKEIYPVIYQLVTLLYEQHSGFLTPAETLTLLNDTSAIIYPRGSSQDSIGYVEIPHYTSSERKLSDWADSLRKKFLEFSNLHVKGLIIDLRGNYGGSHLPMLQGLAPVLGEGFIFSEKNNKGAIDSLFILNGNLIKKTGGNITYRFPTSNSPGIFPSQLRIAVLIDSVTASAGEITAIALKVRKRVKLFGESSAGYPTLNKVFLMPDNAMLYLVNRVIKDAAGNTFTDKIHPDQGINPAKGAGPITAAIKWILTGE